MEKACNAARAAGKHFGSLAITTVQMRRLMDMGADFLMAYSDMAAIAESFDGMAARLAAAGIA